MIKLDNLTKQFDNFVAVDCLNLTIEPGEVFGFLGQNGAGKTTTMTLLMGMLVPTAGSAQIHGLDCHADRVAVKRSVGYLPENPQFHNYLRGREIVEFVAEMHGLGRTAAVSRALQVLEELNLVDAMDEFASNYSMGMRKKLALACALVHRPRVLILDEPTNGLDPQSSREVLRMLAEMAAQGSTIFLSTHLLDMAERTCDRVGIIAHGKLLACGSVTALRTEAHSDLPLEELFISLTDVDHAN